jgi:uncharacterized protein
MKWRGRRESDNVDDQRGGGGSGGGFGGFPGGLLSKGGIGTIVVLLLISWVTGTNPLSLLQQTGGLSPDQAQTTEITGTPEEEDLKNFVEVILGSTEDVWHQLKSDYSDPRLSIFRGEVQSGCGSASSSSGPFYCSTDERVYIDLGFFEEMSSQLNAPGDFAQAYVIAHEVGHHVQHLLGTTDKVHNMRNQLSDEEYNQYSVRLELQADFYAGVWAHYAKDGRDFIEEGDIEEALNAAAAIGDDRLQKQFQGSVNPESFTHGTSEQRVRWFKKGFMSGDLNQGDTFTTNDL